MAGPSDTGILYITPQGKKPRRGGSTLSVVESPHLGFFVFEILFLNLRG